MNPGLITAFVVLLAATAFGLWRKRTDGVVRSTDPGDGARSQGGGPVLTEPVLGGPLGARATLVQFSSAFCAPCRTTRVLLSAVADDVDGVAHYDLDAESHLELVRALDIRRTPTTIVLDADGRETARAGGVPRREQVLTALAAA